MNQGKLKTSHQYQNYKYTRWYTTVELKKDAYGLIWVS